MCTDQEHANWPKHFKFCPKCGKKLATLADQLLTYLRRNEKLSVTKRKKGKWKEWADELEKLMKGGSE